MTNEELEILKEQYARRLREDPEFIRKSAEAERRLKEGPPWDDVIRPSDLLDARRSQEKSSE